MDPHQGPPQADILIGQTIGNYRVTQKLGEGGMGAVYLAEHPQIGKRVALKVLHAEYSNNAEVAERFFNEAKAVNNIGHPNIVDIVDYGVIQSGAIGREQLVYFIMEYLTGNTLSHLIRAEAPLPPQRALAIGMQVADALSASHKCGIVHRDLKPDNIMLMQRGRDADFVKLLDFGIAKLTSSADGSSRTRTGIVMGTPAYMSPEQCEGKNEKVDARTDVYALGVVLYEMLTGRVPFIGEGYGEILVQHLTQVPVPPSQYRMLPPHVEIVVMKALEKRPDLRFPNMDEFMRALADPVGYVEAHGGVGQFLHRQLMPSSAPLPPMRPSAQYTPLPGALQTPSGIYQPTPAPGSVHGATPAPTTLGAAAGQVEGKRGKAGFIVAAILILAGAGVAIAVVAGGGKKDEGEPADKPVVAVADAMPAVTPDAQERTVPPADAAAAVVDAAPLTIDAPPTPSLATIKIVSKPAGAAIFLDGKDSGQKTPAELPFDKTLGNVEITLKLDRYEELTKSISVTADATETLTLKKKSSGSSRPTNPGRGSGSNRRPDGDGLERPE